MPREGAERFCRTSVTDKVIPVGVRREKLEITVESVLETLRSLGPPPDGGGSKPPSPPLDDDFAPLVKAAREVA